MFIQSMTFHLHMDVTLSQTSMSYTNNSGNTLPNLKINTKLLLIPTTFQPWNSRLVAKHTSRLNYFIQFNLPRNSLRNSLDQMKCLHVPAPIRSAYNFQTVSTLYTWFS